jgi:hypothetical protein
LPESHRPHYEIRQAVAGDAARYGPLSRVLPAALLAAITVIGIGRNRWRGRELDERAKRLNQFRDRLVAYIDSQGKDAQAYAELTATVERLQREAGSAAVVSRYRPAYRDEVYHNFEILINILPSLHREVSAGGLRIDERLIREYVTILDSTLNRYAGRLREWAEQLDRDALNPLVWFREGIRALLLLPTFLLRSLGLWPRGWSPSVGSSGLFQVISAIVSFVFLVAALVQIVTGWDATLEKLRAWGIPVFVSDSTVSATAGPDRWY